MRFCTHVSRSSALDCGGQVNWKLSPPPAAAPSPTWSPVHQIPTTPLRLFSSGLVKFSFLCHFPQSLHYEWIPHVWPPCIHSLWYHLILPVLVLQNKGGSCSSPDLLQKDVSSPASHRCSHLVCTRPHSVDPTALVQLESQQAPGVGHCPARSVWTLTTLVHPLIKVSELFIYLIDSLHLNFQ